VSVATQDPSVTVELILVNTDKAIPLLKVSGGGGVSVREIIRPATGPTGKKITMTIIALLNLCDYV
jgi:hypothetical protein